ncbi:NADH dehydrogenase [ubiquinone] iron-sulfur protein 6 [Cricetulus griseus]|nr:NADH dehydrogenase [ubiquinone] iron-sulfur protein 6 [Cricetulus griseus]
MESGFGINGRLPRSHPLRVTGNIAAVLTFRRLLALPRVARAFGVRVSPSGEKITHTGQIYDEKDYRRIRFVDRQKEVNENFAIDLIAEQPVK